MKEEQHQLKLKEHYWQKEIEIEKVVSKRLKQNLEVMRKDQVVLNNRVKELEAMVESIEDYIKDLKDFKDRYTKECSKVLHRDNIINKLSDELKKNNNELKEYRAWKEFYRGKFLGDG